MIFNMSGGGAALNFTVIPNPKPETAKENTIWVDTDSITSWVFSATAPENPKDGMVWFCVGSSSTAAFNALKKNNVMVYPLFANQYVSGAWVIKTAETYQGDAWVDWVKEAIIVENGVISAEYGFGTNVVSNSDYNGTITQKDGYFLLQSKSSYSTIRCTDKKVNLTGIKSIELDVDALTNTTHSSNALLSGLSLIVLSGNKSADDTASSALSLVVAQAQTKTKGRQTLIIDNTQQGLTGEYYIGIILCAYGSSGAGKANVYNLKCV